MQHGANNGRKKEAIFPPWLLDIVRSPQSGEYLRFEDQYFLSPKGERFDIIEGIPCLLARNSTAQHGASSEDYYDQLAQEYRAQDDFWNNPYDSEIWRLEHDLLKDRLTLPGPMLDVGCGFYPHFKFSTSRHVVAGDISFKSILVAREFGDECGSVLFVQFDAAALPFADQSFGCLVVGGELLNHIPDYTKALSEFRRVLMPGGTLLLQIGAKWCFDSIWAMADSFIGHPFGYSLTKQEALSFFRPWNADVQVTWGITPSGDFRVALMSVRKLKRAIREFGFKTSDIYGANCISGIIPLPVQQETENSLVQSLVSGLIRIDRLVGRLPFFRSFSGNVFFICERRA